MEILVPSFGNHQIRVFKFWWVIHFWINVSHLPSHWKMSEPIVFVYFQQKDSFWFSNCITRRIKTQVKHNVKVNAKKVNIWSSQNKCIYSLGIEINYFLKFKLSTNGSTKKVLQFQLITLSSIYNIKLRCCKKSIPIEILSQNRKWGLTYAKVPLFAWIFIWFQMKKFAAVYISL